MDLKQIFEEYGQSTVAKLRQSFEANNINASGRLSNSLQSDVKETDSKTTLQVSMFRYGLTAEDGRGPTRKSQNGVLFDRIRQWIDDKGLNIPANEKEGVAWAITKKIHREGTLQFRKTKQTGRGSGVVSGVVNDKLVEEIVSAVADQQAQDVADKIVSSYKNASRQ